MNPILPNPTQFNTQFAITPGLSKVLSVLYKIHRYWRWQKYFREIYGKNGENIPLAGASRGLDLIIGKETLLGRLYTGAGLTLLIAKCVLSTLEAYRRLSQSCAIFKEHYRSCSVENRHCYESPKALQLLFGKALSDYVCNALIHQSYRLYYIAKMVFAIAKDLFTVSQHLLELGEALLLEKEIKKEARQMMLVNLKTVLETINQSKEGLLQDIDQNKEAISQFVDKIGIPGITGKQVIAITKKGIEKTEQANSKLLNIFKGVYMIVAANINHLTNRKILPIEIQVETVSPSPHKKKIKRDFCIDLDIK